MECVQVLEKALKTSPDQHACCLIECTYSRMHVRTIKNSQELPFCRLEYCMNVSRVGLCLFICLTHTETKKTVIVYVY